MIKVQRMHIVASHVPHNNIQTYKRAQNKDDSRISHSRSLQKTHNEINSGTTTCLETVAQATEISILETNGFRRGVGLCIVNREGLVFAAKRMDDVQNTWQMPQGGIDPLENPLVAARRELFEETGIAQNVRLISTIDTWLDYEFPTKVPACSPGKYIRYRGQTQKWLLLHFTGHDTEIDIHSGDAEFSEWRWMPLDQLPGSVVDFKREVYKSVAEKFVPIINSKIRSL